MGDKGFIKLNRGYDLSIHKYPNAFNLLCVIAQRAKRVESFDNNGLKIGEALIGDFKNYGLTEQEYRTAKKQLKSFKLITDKLNSAIFDINVSDGNGLANTQATDKRFLNKKANNSAIHTQSSNNIVLKKVTDNLTPKVTDTLNKDNPDSLTISDTKNIESNGLANTLPNTRATDGQRLTRSNKNVKNNKNITYVPNGSKSVISEGIDFLTNLLGTTPPHLHLQRFALKRLYKTHGKEKVLKAIEIALSKEVRGNRYAPIITNFIELEQKWAGLETHLMRRNAEKTEGSKVYDATNIG